MGPSNYSITSLGDVVTFTRPSAGGIFVVKVFLNLSTPRIMAYGKRDVEETPASLFMDEINWFILQAKVKLGRGAPPSSDVPGEG